MTRLLALAVLLAAAPAVRAQDETPPDETGATTSEGGAGIGHGAADKAPTANPTGASPGDDCTGPALPIGKFTVSARNGWFPKVSPDGAYVGYGFGGTGLVNVRTREEKVLDTRHTFTMGWIKPNVFRYLIGDPPGSYSFDATAPDFTPKQTPDDPLMNAANFHAAADGHWAGVLAGGGFRLVYDGKVIATGNGGSPDVSGEWLSHFTTNENQSITVRKGGAVVATYAPKFPSTQVTDTDGYLVYSGPGPNLRGITPQGQDVDLTVAPPGYLEGSGKMFYVGRGADRKPWVSSVFWGGAGPCYTMLRPWGSKKGILLDDCASGISVVEHCGVITVARNDDKGKLTIVTLPSNAPQTGAPNGSGDDLITWVQPKNNGSAPKSAGLFGLSGLAGPSVKSVEIRVNKQRVGDAKLSSGVWTYLLDLSAYGGGINLSAVPTTDKGPQNPWTIRFNVTDDSHSAH